MRRCELVGGHVNKELSHDRNQGVWGPCLVSRRFCAPSSGLVRSSIFG